MDFGAVNGMPTLSTSHQWLLLKGWASSRMVFCGTTACWEKARRGHTVSGPHTERTEVDDGCRESKGRFPGDVHESRHLEWISHLAAMGARDAGAYRQAHGEATVASICIGSWSCECLGINNGAPRGDLDCALTRSINSRLCQPKSSVPSLYPPFSTRSPSHTRFMGRSLGALRPAVNS